MPDIHPTAAISPQAQLADDVVVGPHCTILGAVTIGPGTRLIGHAYLQGPLTLGRNNVVYPFACLGFAPQHRRFDPNSDGAGLVIGDDNTFRESVTIHRAFAPGGRPTTIGDRNYFMVASHVGHDSVIGNDCNFANSALIAGHVDVGNNITVGGNAGVHQFVRLGRLSMVGGASPCTQDLPPFCVMFHNGDIVSLNLIGLRRAGYRNHIPALKRAFNIFFLGGHANQNAIELIEREVGDDPLCREFTDFIRGTRRGIAPYGGSRGASAGQHD